MKEPIAIAGAGVAGLASALVCQQNGIPFQLFDPAEYPLQGGVAFTLWPNALRALQSLSIMQNLPDWMHPIQRGDIRSGKNRPLYAVPIAWMKQNYGFAPVCVRRTDLVQALWIAAGCPSIRRDGVVSVEQDENGVNVHLQSGDVTRASAVLAADGIHSTVRAQFLGDARRTMNYSAWRGIACTGKSLMGEMREYWAPAVRFGYANMDEGHTYWFATVNHHLLSKNRALWWEEAKRLLYSLPQPVQECLAGTDFSAIFAHAVQELTPGKPIVFGRTALIGDAAHAITPNLGMGACLALEDAACLHLLLAKSMAVPHLPHSPHSPHLQDDTDTLKRVFRTYDNVRRRRTTYMAHATRWLGAATQVENQAFTTIRDSLIRSVPAKRTTLVWRALLGSPKGPLGTKFTD